ncbi:MAG: carbohydrate porin [Gammaproteobacteria bacterium]|nr:carbohydrate porin [Gammaproteobacteria bacterium]MBU1554783.1 carbohydrate porin [Gammaproteobacteria bacterium]MBU2069995.1 carbohydrate porin [Gammaproteobacteria bacterium]MBU2185140.1 carbohydrate porin [Gammaproteobacteria bacterium]MBU2207008.1 carbohydrate porin [Gammaproteobacteria bacterium]
MFSLRSISLIAAMGLCHFSALATETDDIKQQLAALKAQIAALEQRLAEQEVASEKAAAIEAQQQLAAADDSKKPQDGIKLGGAIRTNYSHTSYSDGNKNRGGDFAFDIFRLNLNGSIGDVLLNAEIRFFDYMTAVKYAYVGYQLNEDWQVQAGITQVPFGNWPYNSHNYFFSTNYYLGLEDDHDLGLLFKRRLADNWQLDLGFFKNDELGGIDGYVSSRADRYSYDIVGYRQGEEGIYDDPAHPLGEYNTFAGRFAYQFEHCSDFSTELGLSALAGGLHNGRSRAGSYNAWALHLNSHYQRWNLQLQHGEYHYDIDDIDRMAVGAYAFYDSIAAKAKTSTFNLAYSLPIEWGPVTGLQFYNNYGLVYDKSDNSRDTMMNVTGVSVAAGGLFTYFDLVHAKNQPFVGGSAAGDSNDTERRFNINIGYYF